MLLILSLFQTDADSIDQMSNLQIRGQLLLQGETIVSWATRRGYPPATVQRVIHRWTRPGTDRGLPRGAMTRAILRDLSTDTGVTIPAGMDWATSALARTRPTRPPAITHIPRRRAAGTE